jgi:hypothetical protein
MMHGIRHGIGADEMQYCKAFKTEDRVRHEARPDEVAIVEHVDSTHDKLTVRWPDGSLMVDLAYHFTREAK